jgi:hypothetical protein
MSTPPGTPYRPGTVTLCVAWGVLASIAGIQAFVGFGMPSQEAAAPPLAQEKAAPAPVVAAEAPVPPAPVPVPEPVVTPPVLAVTVPPESPVVPAPTALVPPAPVEVAPPSLDVPIKDEAVLAELEKGLFHKEAGDLIVAVGHFRSAWEKMPDHPRLIFQLAQTYDLMGLEKRSAPLWTTLRALGKSAGDFGLLAEQRFSQTPDLATATDAAKPELEPAAAELPAKKLTIADIKVSPDKNDKTGERQAVTFSLKKATTEPITPEEVSVVVSFFEIVNGRKIDRSQLPEEPQIFQLAAPLDWADGQPEPLQVDYFQPRMSPAEILKFGHRTYYGQVVEVFYQRRLQDVQADPPELAAFTKEIPLEAPNPDNPAPPLPVPSGLDASLFPNPGPPIGSGERLPQ